MSARPLTQRKQKVEVKSVISRKWWYSWLRHSGLLFPLKHFNLWSIETPTTSTIETKDFSIHGCLQWKFTKKYGIKFDCLVKCLVKREEMEIFTSKFSLDDQYITIGLGDGKIQVYDRRHDMNQREHSRSITLPRENWYTVSMNRLSARHPVPTSASDRTMSPPIAHPIPLLRRVNRIHVYHTVIYF
jgi:hypothetical protein